MFFYIAVALIPLFMLMAALFVIFGKRNEKKEVIVEEPEFEQARRVTTIPQGPKVHRATDPSF